MAGWRVVPTRRLIGAVAACGVGVAVAAVAGATPVLQALLAALGLLTLAAVAGWDAWRTRALLRHHPLTLTRHLPAVLPHGVPREVQLHLQHEGPHAWQALIFDGIDPHWDCTGLPLAATLPGESVSVCRYSVTALRRGAASMGPAQVRLRTPQGWWQWELALGASQGLRVFPDFAEVARYAWLADSRRLADVGIRSALARGQGTDFRQLADYQPGDSVRHIDWKATQRRGHPVVRQFQDERDQRVWLLLDCGRRQRADDALNRPGVQQFDRVLNALLLLAHVALKAGDEVGLITFGHEPGEVARRLAPRKGSATLDQLMATLHDVQPGWAHPDFRAVAHELMQQGSRRALVVVLTVLRDEDAPELAAALALLRSRHLVSVASLRDPTLAAIAAQPLGAAQSVAEVATAHLLGQLNRRTLASLSAPGTWLLDVLPADLPATLVNHYSMLKRSHRL